MSLLDRYVKEVGSHLPPKQRTDIEAEIKSSLQDILQEKSARTGVTVDETLMLAVLKEYGKPEKVAASYLPPRYLIGPELFPIFWLVLKIGLGIVAAIAVLVFAARTAVGDIQSWAEVGANISGLFNGAIATLGWVVVTFIILERFLPLQKLKGKERDWDPAELLKKPDTELIPLSTPIVAILFTLAALILFNIFPDFVAIKAVKTLTDNEWVTLITLTDAFYAQIPWLNVLWLLSLGFHGATIWQRRWQPWTRAAQIGLHVFSIVILIRLITGADIIYFDPAALEYLNAGGAPLDNIGAISNIGLRAALGIAVVVSLFEIGKNGYKMVNQQ